MEEEEEEEVEEEEEEEEEVEEEEEEVEDGAPHHPIWPRKLRVKAHGPAILVGDAFKALVDLGS